MRKMKNSGVPWIGEIPESWSRTIIKNAYSIDLGKMLDSSHSESEWDNYLCAANLDWSGVSTAVNKKMFFSTEEKAFLRLSPGDVLITEGGDAGVSCIYAGEFDPCFIQNSVLRGRSKNGNLQKYLYYWLFAAYHTGYMDAVCNKATITHYSKEKVKATPIILPMPAEQKVIVSYLDQKCATIDEAIARRQQIIERLENYRKAVILKAVTKGLNQDVEMKESGIPWIGSIPKSWKVTRVKYGISVSGSGTTPKSDNPKYYNGTIPWIQSGDLYFRKEVDETSKHVTELALNTCPALKLYKPPFIVMAMYGASVGNVAISNIEACVNQACCVLKPTQNVKMEFLSYWLNVCKEDLVSQAIGGGQPNISQRTIKEEALLIPPLSEQSEIVAFLDDTCERIDDIYARNIELILRLEEYRKSIIYNAVTGKIDCREVV